MYMASVMVMHEQQLKNINKDLLIAECQTGECSAVCTRVSDKLLQSHKESVKHHNDDTLPT
jgi:hypothetical protein